MKFLKDLTLFLQNIFLEREWEGVHTDIQPKKPHTHSSVLGLGF